MDIKMLDNLTNEELIKLSKEIHLRLNYRHKIELRTTYIGDLDWSVRAFNCLRNLGVKTMTDLSKISSREVMKVKNIGKGTMKEFNDMFNELHMEWDYKKRIRKIK